MRRPTRPNRRRRAVQSQGSIPFPYKGWNARDPISDMNPEFATILDNIFPATDKGELRKGNTSWATGLSGQVETLMEYGGLTGNEFYAASDGNIYDVTTTGVVGAAVVSGKTNAQWQHIVFGSAGLRYLYIVNGADAPLHYNGTVWANPAITGASFTPANMIHINEFKERIFFIEKDTLSFWYMDTVSAVAGTVKEFPLESFCDKGGSLVAMGTWSIDGGVGLDDLAVFITSKGQVIVYQGTDPGVAGNWALIGVFNIGEPIGRRCLIKFGGDLLVVSQDGLVPLSINLIQGRSNKRVAISDNIRTAFSNATQLYGDNFGWQPVVYPNGNMLLVNVPIIEKSLTYQYVMNTTTGAWCRFTELNASCLGIFSKDLYMGITSQVMKLNDSRADVGSNITGELQTAFNYLRRRGLQKHVKLIRPIIQSNGTVSATLKVNADFEDASPSAVPTFSGSSGPAWDSVQWDTSQWGGEDISKDWQAAEAIGMALAVRMEVLSNAVKISIHSFDLLYEVGKPL